MSNRAGHDELIAREGLVFFLPPAAVSGLCWWFGYPGTALLLLIVSVAIALFFRNPKRKPPDGEGIVLSPADGTVVAIVDNAHSNNVPGENLKRISIFMSVFNVHVNRWPVSGKVERITYVPGRFLDAREPDSSTVNEHNSIVVTGESPVEVVQIAGKIARRIACWVREGDEVLRGDRFGLIRFGSRLDVYVRDDHSFVVDIGTKVRAGETIIARSITHANLHCPGRK